MACSRVRLSQTEIQAALAAAPGWTLADGKLRKEYRFPDFARAMAFVNRVASVAEDADHHPDIDIRYNRVALTLLTHDAHGITRSDAEMAARLNQEFGDLT